MLFCIKYAIALIDVGMFASMWKCGLQSYNKKFHVIILLI